MIKLSRLFLGFTFALTLLLLASCKGNEGTTIIIREGTSTGIYVCNDGIDNDGDGYVDYDDPGCAVPEDGSELSWLECDDGFDNDGDTFADYPDDPGCSSILDDSELGSIQCDDGIDNDGDTLVDVANDPGCSDVSDTTELGSNECDDGLDNDGDTKEDYPDDPGCSDVSDTDEFGANSCDDGLDNDMDSYTDYPDDPGCKDISDTSELEAVAIEGGKEHTCALTSIGGVKCWGLNLSGQLGDGTRILSNTPVDVSGLTSGVTEIAVGEYHSCALTDTGGVKCWGQNGLSQLGIGAAGGGYRFPMNVSGLTSGVKAIAAGKSHTCALTTPSGGVKCWGNNAYGQLGDNTTNIGNSPVDVIGLSSGVADISAGYFHTCAVTTTGGAKCWGANWSGRLGDGTLNISLIPVDVFGLSTGVATIEAGGSHTCAITTPGGLKCWGDNGFGQLGDGSNTWSLIPKNVLGLSINTIAVSLGIYHSCALNSSGAVKCWGENINRQLGDGTNIDRNIPVIISSLNSGVLAIGAGSSHTCVIAESGEPKCFGGNWYGQIGDGNTGHKTHPVDVTGLTSDVLTIDAGGFHSCAITGSGGAKCWGDNGFGQLGNETTEDSPFPRDVTGLTSGVSSIRCGGGWHTCALTTLGAVKCWGDNLYGQLGNNTNSGTAIPVDVTGLTDDIVAIDEGRWHSCALTSTGGVKCWGLNDDGQLGDGTWNNSNVPVDVVGLPPDVIALTSGWYHNCVLTSMGEIKCWGQDLDGQLGDGFLLNSNTPVDVAGLGSAAIQVSGGGDHTCALLDTGGIQCWGYNGSGQLGVGTSTDSPLPLDVIGLTSGVAAISSGEYFTCALMTAGNMKCWGHNTSGQLGNDSWYNSSLPVDVLGLAETLVFIESGEYHTCAITASGGAKCWGNNNAGPVGVPWYADAPVDVVWF